jgi:hypothetical protein
MVPKLYFQTPTPPPKNGQWEREYMKLLHILPFPPDAAVILHGSYFPWEYSMQFSFRGEVRRITIQNIGKDWKIFTWQIRC